MVFRFHMKSSGFQVKSTQNLIKSDVSTKTIQFDECRREAMTLDFMKSGVIAPSMHPPPPPNWRVFVETSDFIRFWVDFTWNPPDFMVKSTGFHGFYGFHEIRQISWWNPPDFTDFMKSTRFHGEIRRISWWNPPDFTDFMNVSFWVMIKYRSFYRKTNYWYLGIMIVFAIAKDYVWQGRMRCQVNLAGSYDPANLKGMFGLLHRTEKSQNLFSLYCMYLSFITVYYY